MHDPDVAGKRPTNARAVNFSQLNLHGKLLSGTIMLNCSEFVLAPTPVTILVWLAISWSDGDDRHRAERLHKHDPLTKMLRILNTENCARVAGEPGYYYILTFYWLIAARHFS